MTKTRNFNPVRVIEWVFALFTLAGAGYILNPLYALAVRQNGRGVFAAALSDPIFIIFWSILLFLGAALVIGGLLVNQRLRIEYPTLRARLRASGWFCIFLARFFQVLTTVLTVGPLPLSPWIHILTLSAIACVLWLNAKAEI